MKKKKVFGESIQDEERKTQDMSAVADYNGEKSNRAKVVEHEGDDYEDVPVKDDSLSGKTKNFFYHYKWHVVAAVVILVVGFIGIYQMVGRDKAKSDLSVIYAGPKTLAAEEEDGIKKVLGELLAKDINGDGEKKVFLYTSRYVPTGNADSKGYTDERFRGIIATGECGVMFVDKELFETLKQEGAVESFEKAIGYSPAGAFDEYGIRLDDTDAYKYFTALQAMPGDTVVCVRAKADPFMTPEKTAEKYHSSAVTFIKGFFDFKITADSSES